MAATPKEFPQIIQAPSSTHPGTTYPGRAEPSLRFQSLFMGNSLKWSLFLSEVCKHITLRSTPQIGSIHLDMSHMAEDMASIFSNVQHIQSAQKEVNL